MRIQRQEFPRGRTARHTLLAVGVFLFLAGAVAVARSAGVAGGLTFMAAGVGCFALLRQSRDWFGVLIVDSEGLTITRGQARDFVPWTAVRSVRAGRDGAAGAPGAEGAAGVIAALLVDSTSDAWRIDLRTAQGTTSVHGTDVYRASEARACLLAALKLAVPG